MPRGICLRVCVVVGAARLPARLPVARGRLHDRAPEPRELALVLPYAVAHASAKVLAFGGSTARLVLNAALSSSRSSVRLARTRPVPSRIGARRRVTCPPRTGPDPVRGFGPVRRESAWRGSGTRRADHRHAAGAEVALAQGRTWARAPGGSGSRSRRMTAGAGSPAGGGGSGQTAEGARAGEQPAQAAGGRPGVGQRDVAGRRRETSAPGPAAPGDMRQPSTDEPALIARIVALATRCGRSGSRRITAVLRQEGGRVQHTRVERRWRPAGRRVSANHPSGAVSGWRPARGCGDGRSAPTLSGPTPSSSTGTADGAAPPVAGHRGRVHAGVPQPRRRPAAAPRRRPGPPRRALRRAGPRPPSAPTTAQRSPPPRSATGGRGSA